MAAVRRFLQQRQQHFGLLRLIAQDMRFAVTLRVCSRNFHAGNHRHARSPPKLQRAFAARHGIVVGERERRHAAERSKLYKLLKRRGAVRISCVAVQVNRHWFSPFAAFPADASAAFRLCSAGTRS